MHEAIVAQLHPQDQRFLPGSAVPLHQKTRGRERVEGDKFQEMKEDRVNEWRKQKWKRTRENEVEGGTEQRTLCV